MSDFNDNQNIMNENCSSKFNQAIEQRLNDKSWSAKMATEVLRTRKRRGLKKISAVAVALLFLVGSISYGSLLYKSSSDNGYAQLSQYLYADVNYDYDVLDLLK